jgi:Holliday junction resolvase RusA-like endonuclease
MTEIEFTIPMIPVAKGRPRFARCGSFVRAYTPKKTVTAENDIIFHSGKYAPKEPFASRVIIELRFFMPTLKSASRGTKMAMSTELMPHTKKPDIDNFCKAVFDALNGVFWTDDAIIWKVSAEKLYSDNPRIEVKIKGK